MTKLFVFGSQPDDDAWITRVLDGAVEVVVAAELDAATTAPIIAIGDPTAPPEHVAHVITRAWSDEAIKDLCLSLASRRPRPAPPLSPPRTAADAQDAQRTIAAGRTLAGATSLAAFERTAVEILHDLVDADRAYCLFYDGDDAALWSEARLASGADDRRATAGLVGFVARTGVPIRVEHAGDDPRFVGANDDPDGDALDRLLVQAVLGDDGDVHAVLVAARTGQRAAFDTTDASRLAQLARLAAPLLDQISLQRHAEAILDEVHADSPFRREAIEAQAMPRWGDVLRVTPRWVPWAYRMLVVLLVVSAAVVVFGTVSSYSAGPAIVRSTANTPITAVTAGNIAAVEVSPGDAVEAGVVITRLDDADQRTAVARLEHEFETQLRNHMLDPADSSADSALRSVRNELETARTRLGERVIRASKSGIISDVRAHLGQRVEPGDIVASLIDKTQRLELIALLPGEDRPQLAPGMELRLELAGYRYAYQSVVIDQVSPDVISPGEARRILGAEVAESLELAGPVVLVRAWLPRNEFEIDGRTLRYHDGMRGTAEVRLRAERILFALVPGTRRLL